MHALDHKLLGLEVDPADPCLSSFELAPQLCRYDGQLYGGTALGVALAAFEEATQRQAWWATVQFVSPASIGERFDCVTEVLAHGRGISQVMLRASVGDRLVFTALGSTGVTKDGAMEGTGPVMPEVPEPDERGGSWFSNAGNMPIGWHLAADLGEVPILDGADARGHMAMWVRVRDHAVTTTAKLGYLADMVPVAVARMCGVLGAGTSLDNSLRVGRLVDTEWVLLEIRGQTAVGGAGHGSVVMWAPDGTLLAVASQTAKMFAMTDLSQFVSPDVIAPPG